MTKVFHQTNSFIYVFSLKAIAARKQYQKESEYIIRYTIPLTRANNIFMFCLSLNKNYTLTNHFGVLLYLTRFAIIAYMFLLYFNLLRLACNMIS